MAVAREGKLCFLKAFGNSVKLDTMFDTGWMTNSVTSLATFLLIDRGELALDTPLSFYFPQVLTGTLQRVDEAGNQVPCKSSITIRHLLSHTSGLSYGSLCRREEGDPMAEADKATERFLHEVLRVEDLPSIPLGFEPGSRFRYSPGYALLGSAIEQCTGKPLEEFCNEQIFVPLGMSETFWTIPANKVGQLSGPISTTKVRGDGGLHTTAADWIKFLESMANKFEPLLSSDAWGSMIAPPDGARWENFNTHSTDRARSFCREAFASHGSSGERAGADAGLTISTLGKVANGKVANLLGASGGSIHGWGGLSAPETQFLVDPRENKLTVVLFGQGREETRTGQPWSTPLPLEQRSLQAEVLRRVYWALLSPRVEHKFHTLVKIDRVIPRLETASCWESDLQTETTPSPPTTPQPSHAQSAPSHAQSAPSSRSRFNRRSPGGVEMIDGSNFDGPAYILMRPNSPHMRSRPPSRATAWGSYSRGAGVRSKDLDGTLQKANQHSRRTQETLSKQRDKSIKNRRAAEARVRQLRKQTKMLRERMGSQDYSPRPRTAPAATRRQLGIQVTSAAANDSTHFNAENDQQKQWMQVEKDLTRPANVKEQQGGMQGVQDQLDRELRYAQTEGVIMIQSAARRKTAQTKVSNKRSALDSERTRTQNQGAIMIQSVAREKAAKTSTTQNNGKATETEFDERARKVP
jgi:CubicO group peptidase (beta-lactamase class C family)